MKPVNKASLSMLRDLKVKWKTESIRKLALVLLFSVANDWTDSWSYVYNWYHICSG